MDILSSIISEEDKEEDDGLNLYGDIAASASDDEEAKPTNNQDSAMDSTPVADDDNEEDKQIEEASVAATVVYFIVRPANMQEVVDCYNNDVYKPSKRTASKLLDRMAEGRVFAIVSAANTTSYQGYFELREVSEDGFSLFDSRASFVPYLDTQQLPNKFNGNETVNHSYDGQELDAECGSVLLDMLNRRPEETMHSLNFKAASCPPPQVGNKRVIHAPAEWYRRNLNGDHGYLDEMDVTQMSYEEYVNEYKAMQQRAFQQYQASMRPGFPMGGAPMLPMNPGGRGPVY